MLITVREILLEARVAYRNNFRPLTKYLVFASIAFFVLWMIASIPFLFAKTQSGNFTKIGFYTLSFFLSALALFLYFKIMIGFQLQLRRALHKQKLLSIKESILETKTITLKALLSCVLSGVLSYSPLVLGLIGIALQNKNTFITWMISTLQFPESATLPNLEIHGVSGYFFFLLSLYGLCHLLYFSVIFSMSYFAVLFDKKNVQESLEKSNTLLQGQWFSVWSRFVATKIILLALYATLMFLSYGFQKQFGLFAGSISDMLVAVFINFFAAIPLMYLPALIIFEELMKKPTSPMLRPIKQDKK